jgi:hypothetical protein
MSEAIKVLGQANPPAATLTDLYTSPAGGKGTVVSSVVIANQAAAAITFRVSIAVAGAADAVKQYLYFDVTLAAHATLAAVIGITLAPTDVLRVRSSVATTSFNAFGTELT